MKLVLPLCLLLAACNTGGGNNPSPPPVQASNWTFFYGTTQGRCDDFDFPQQGSANYCIRLMGARVGQTIYMTFTISGSGTPRPVEAADAAPASLRLFMWRRGDNLSCAGQYQQYRLFDGKVDLTPGTHSISVAISPENWTDCYGQSGSQNPGAFQATVNDLQGMGYTFGGQYFAGHGVAANGQVHFHLDNYSVGDSIRKRKKR